MKQPATLLKFIELLQLEYPDAKASIDAPDDPKGEHWLDIVIGGYKTEVAWRPAFGFGIYTSDDVGFGEGPDEIYKQPADACARLCQLEAQWRRDRSIGSMSLKDLRHLVGAQQTELAAAMDINQAAVSKLENRDDLLLSTLVGYIAAMGGVLEMRVRFKEFQARIELAAHRN